MRVWSSKSRIPRRRSRPSALRSRRSGADRPRAQRSLGGGCQTNNPQGDVMKSYQLAALTTLIVASALCAGVSTSQQVGVATRELRAQTIVASFNKSKHVVKEKRGVRKEKYLDVRGVPAIKQNPADYSGAYEDLSGMGFSLRRRVDGSGLVGGHAYRPVEQ